jgi:hypothetical protein
MIQFAIDAQELRRALADIERAEANGFHYCLAVLELRQIGPMLGDCQVAYSDLIERAHPYSGRLNWGRHQNIVGRFRFADGRLIPIEVKEDG